MHNGPTEPGQEPRRNYCAICGMRLPSSGHRGRWLCHFCLDAEIAQRRGKDEMTPPATAPPAAPRRNEGGFDYCPYCWGASIERRTEHPGSGWLFIGALISVGITAVDYLGTAAMPKPAAMVAPVLLLVAASLTRCRTSICGTCARRWRE